MFDSWSADARVASPRRIEFPLLSGARTGEVRRRLSALLKRAFDICVALSALIVLFWAFLAIAAAVALTSRGPVFFRQRRTGLNGQIFRIYKFRTMTVAEDGDVVAHASKNDARVTRVGAVLRSTSLDELPQFINILKGDMSFVGPRPHALAHDKHYGALLPRYADRFAVRPGLTGLAQVRGLRGEIHRLDCMAQRVDADAEYAARWSFRRDLLILVSTVPMLIRRVNAY